MNSNIDFLIVGAGLYGAAIARILTDSGFTCLIIDRRNHIAGNIYSERVFDNIDKHVYGPHIFHTNNDKVIEFVTKYGQWNQYQQNTIAFDGKNLYNLPFNCSTYCQIFNVTTPEEAYNIINKEISEANIKNPQNLEEQAISMVGKTIFNKLIKNYTEKQWNDDCKNLSADIIKRLPLRFSFNNNYFNDKFQAIPENGYTEFVENIIGSIPYLLEMEFDYEYWKDKARTIIYCGAVDELLNYELGPLTWRSLKFQDTIYEWNGHNGQGMAVKNLVGHKEEMEGTRIVEHMWFRPNEVNIRSYKNTKTSIQTLEIPDDWEIGKERYYAVNNKNTQQKYEAYCNLLNKQMPNIILGGRLGKYKYFDMDDTIIEAMNDASQLIKNHYVKDYDRFVR